MNAITAAAAPLDAPAPAAGAVAWEDRAVAFALPDDALYLDTASHAPLLRSVDAAAHRALQQARAPWRHGEADWRAPFERVRTLAAQLLFDDDVDGVAMVPSVAHALAIAAGSLPLRRGDAVLLLGSTFPSELLAWQQRCAETGATLVAIADDGDADLTATVLQALDASARPAVLALPHCHWHDGRLLDLDTIAAAAQARATALVLDLSQSLGVLPARLAQWRPAFVATVGYKWTYGPAGLAWLWASPQWRRHGRPIEHHWQAYAPGPDWVFPAQAAPPHAAGARRFDAGGVADPLRLAMAEAGLRQLARWRPARIAAELAALTAALDAALEAHDLAHWRTPGHGPHIAGLRVPPQRRAAVLAAFGAAQVICAVRGGGLRLAPHPGIAPARMEQVVALAAAAH